MTFDNGGDQHDEGAGRSADLEAAATERGDEKSADNGGEESRGGRQTGTDGDRHGERKRDDGDGQAGNSVGTQVGQPIARAQLRRELRCEELGEGGLDPSYTACGDRVHGFYDPCRGGMTGNLRRSPSLFR